MEAVTYSLGKNEEEISEYYKNIEVLSKRIINDVKVRGRIFIKDFEDFIRKNHMEILRSEDEYAIEVLLNGVVIEEYMKYALRYKELEGCYLNILNELRSITKFKDAIDKLKGKAISNMTQNKTFDWSNINKKEFSILLKWLKSVGDFKEEVYRLRTWEKFLCSKSNDYVKKFFQVCKECKTALFNFGRVELRDYVKNVPRYLENYYIDHRFKEDLIYCGKGEIQYYFNMISAQVMNKVYEDRFSKCDEKIVFLPGCMRQTEKKCIAPTSSKGKVCKGCFKNCNIRNVSIEGKKGGYKVYTIEHETSLFSKVENNRPIGIVGVACVLNLVSGGWKALRIGFIPQCVLLNHVGCSSHWCNPPIMTNISIERLNCIMKK